MIKILITGGASGLGEALTRRLAQDSACEVYFTYNTSLQKANEIKSEFPNVFPLKCDFRNEEELGNLCSTISVIDPDVLINNAYSGSFIANHFHKTNMEDFLENFKVNILPTVKISQAVIQSFRKRKSGKLITVLTSALNGAPPIGTSVYLANKAYLEELTKIWAIENAKFDITSNSVSPAFMLTSLTGSLDERIVEQIRESSPHKKLLQPEEVAEAVHFMCQPDFKQNGVNLVINAGTTFK